MQSRFDVGLLKTTKLTENVAVEFGGDVFNVFNKLTSEVPIRVRSPDFGRITNTIGGPRVMQFRAKLKF